MPNVTYFKPLPVYVVFLLVTCAMLADAANPPTMAKQVPARSPTNPPPPERPTPTIENFAYGHDSLSQVYDFWAAKSHTPTPIVVIIHGGAWLGGDKTDYGNEYINPYLEAGVSVASVNYRLIRQAMEQHIDPPVKACLYDAARAIQTIRFKAKELNIDPERVGFFGDSAGACSSLWLGMHDELAKPDSKDPIERMSTRPKCVGADVAQTSLDPVQIREWIPNVTYGAHAFGFVAEKGKRPQVFETFLKNREKYLPLIKEYSPIEQATRDDPPIYLSYSLQKQPPRKGQREPDPTHSAMYGVGLKEKLTEVGVEVILTYPGNEEKKYGSISRFIITKLLEE